MPQPLDEKAIAAFREQVLAGLPGGSQAAAIVSEEQNAVSIEGSVSHGITVSYQALGQTFLRNVIIANRPDMQLTFRITAPKDRFDAVQKAFRASIFSWHWVESSKG